MRYLVCRKEALNNGGDRMLNSSYFPIVVTTKDLNPEYIVREAMDMINPGYVGYYEYVVVPLDEALVVSFKPKKSYDVTVKDF